MMGSSIKYIHELPYKPRSQLCRILDADKRWEELGGNYMKLDVTTLTLIGQAIYRDKSPTSELLNKYSEINGTIERLFIWLYKMDHQRAMSILLPYVDQKYHGILRSPSTYSTSLLSYSSKMDIPRPSMSQMSITTTNNFSQLSQVSSAYKHASGACGTGIYKEKENYNLKKSKLDNNANINHNVSSNSLRSKSLNVPHVEPKVIAKKSPDLNESKKNTYSKQESISDNCAPEKMKSPRKPSVQEMLFNGKQLKHSHLPAGANYNSHDDSLPDFMNIPFNEIIKATDNFNEARVLGKGGFGVVYKGEWKGTSVAIKRLMPKRCDNPSRQLVSLKQSLNELNILKCCRFDHILPLYAVSLDGVDPCLIYQLMVNGSLEDRLLCKNKTPPLTWLQRSHIAECTAKGLNYLHTTYEKPLVHGDIKSANILLDANMEAKIGDFGLTREGPNCDRTHVKVTSVHGTECYLPDEYLRCKKLSPQVDIYSYGIVMLEIATGLRPFDPQTKKKLVEYVKACDDSGRLDTLRDVRAGEENMLWFRELIKIGQVCSSTEKRKRPPMQEVLGQFEKVKTEMSMVDNIRRLSNENPIEEVGRNLSPMELQLIYDFKKEGTSNVSENNKMLNISPERDAANSAIPLVIEQMKNFSVSSKENSNESLGGRSSYISSESSTSSESESSTVSQKLINRGPERNVKGDFSFVKTLEADTEARVAPVPLISILQLQVSEFEGNSDAPDSEKLCDSKS